MPQRLQPFLHDLVTVLAAPTQALSAPSGVLHAPAEGPSGHGVLHADLRVLSSVLVAVDGLPGEHIATTLAGGEATFSWLLRHVGPASMSDPQVRLDRVRAVRPGQVSEQLRLGSVLAEPVTVDVAVAFQSDGASIEEVKVGRAAQPRPFPSAPDGDALRWTAGDLSVLLQTPAADLGLTPDGQTATARWRVTVPAGGEAEVGWRLDVEDAAPAVVAAPPPLTEQPTDLAEGVRDHRLRPWLERSLADLSALRMARPEAPEDVFFAAGAPWYLTLFGRDSIWAARMLLPLGVGPALGTLRALAALQGRRVDDQTGEQPGKIMHELRRTSFELGEMTLPPLYYGTIDATPLWVCLLHDAWRAGLPHPQVRTLLPALEAALGWLLEHFDADGDGFGEYQDPTGHGLANQGWKDSADSVRFADGRTAEAPVALCEVQGYAYEAARAGADVLEAFGLPGAERLRAWAGDLAERFRADFWCGSGDGRFPALALDGHKQRVDSLTSNIGHLLGTGLLDADEELVVARHLASPALDCGFGLRTLASTDAAYSPLSYHCGSVWPHDTAIAIAGLRRAGLLEHAAGLVEGLLRASVAFDQRLPELWSGEGRPVPYPAACRPQAWSAAAAVVVAEAVRDMGVDRR